ncbi:hypothetical protein [Paeniglutamicibacter antarcticus]|uniref:Secreted protein n=1 Tax=Paeniglutamicibacter antarcticus TaxID=494023 RepID=A0ABP9TTG1_9MICC
MSKHRATKKSFGWRLAIITYVTVLLLGLGGAGAHALWNMSGAGVGTVTAGSWAPKTIPASEVECSRKDSGSTSKITVTWPAVDADSYMLDLKGEGRTETGKTSGLTWTFNLDRPGVFGSDNYKLAITPYVGGVSSAPAANVDVNVRLYTSGLGEVRCSAAK